MFRLLGPAKFRHHMLRTCNEFRRLHNDELHALYSSQNIIRVIQSSRLRWAGYVAHMANRRGSCGILREKPEGRRQLERPKRRWEDNIKIDLREAGWGHGLDRSGSGQEQLAACCECSNGLRVS